MEGNAVELLMGIDVKGIYANRGLYDQQRFCLNCAA